MSEHPTHNMHDNSVSAYVEKWPKLAQREDAVFLWLTANGPATDRQVMAGLGLPEPNSVRPTITNLVQAGILVEVDRVHCLVTGRLVRRTAPHA